MVVPPQALPDARYVLVTGTSVLVRSGSAQQPPKLLWHDITALRSVGVELADDHFVIHGTRWSLARGPCNSQHHSVQHDVGHLLRVLRFPCRIARFAVLCILGPNEMRTATSNT